MQGGLGRHNKTLLDVYLLNSNLAVRIHKRRYGNGNVHFGDDTIAVLIAWRLYISSLTWASCVAYPFVMAAKARVRDEQRYDSHVFFVYVRIRWSPDIELSNSK